MNKIIIIFFKKIFLKKRAETFLGLLLMLLAILEEEELSWEEGRGSCCLKGAGEILALLGAIVLLVDVYDGTPWLLLLFDPATATAPWPVFKLEAELDSPKG